MNSVQIGRAEFCAFPDSALCSRRIPPRADDRKRDVNPAEPSIVRGSRLARRGKHKTPRAHSCRSAVLYDFLQHAHHEPGDARIHRDTISPALNQGSSVAIPQARNDRRFNEHATVCEKTYAPRPFRERRHLIGTQARQRAHLARMPLFRPGCAAPFALLVHSRCFARSGPRRCYPISPAPGEASMCHRLGPGNCRAGKTGRRTRRSPAYRRPWSPEYKKRGCPKDRRIQRRRINKRLEHRAGRPLGENSIKLAAPVIAPADNGFDLSGMRIECNQGRLGPGDRP